MGATGIAGGVLLDHLERRWRRRLGLAAALAALAIALPAGAVAGVLAGGSARVAVGVAGLVLVVLLVGFWSRRRRQAERDREQLVRHLDRRLPDLEESAELLLAPPSGPLAPIQRARLEAVLAEVDERRLLPSRRPRQALALVGIGAILAAAFWTLAPRVAATRPPSETFPGRVESPSATAVAGDGLEAIEVTVEPPAYTGLGPRRETALALSVAEGATVAWTVRTRDGVDRAVLVAGGETIELAAAGSGAFAASRQIERTLVYSLRLERGGVEVYRGPYARLEMRPDRPPEVRLEAPAERVTVLAAGRPPGELAVDVVARDEYGLGTAELVLTLAEGSGERVQFRDQRVPLRVLAGLDAGERRYAASLDLLALGLVPGGELYVHAEAFDNRRPDPQRGRSTTHILRLPGETRRASDLGDGVPMLLPPEMFRSQRQIIIDTEKLLAEESTVTREDFEQRSQDLGFDQRALRLRYGVLLGEEFESGIPVDIDAVVGADDGHDEHHHGGQAEHEPHGGDDGHDNEQDGGHDGRPRGQHGGHQGHDHGESLPFAEEPGPDDLLATLEELAPGLAHVHDAEESNTYFTTAVRDQLRAALAEMWGSELRLRTFRPRQALPHEYRALKLLKELQQASRVYVQRIGFDPPPLFPDEKRLSGDLSEIVDHLHRVEPVIHAEVDPVRRAFELLRRAADAPAGVGERDLTTALAEASAAILRRAEEDPAIDVSALDALRAVEGKSGSGLALAADAAARSLWALLTPPRARPGRGVRPASRLFEAYRKRLQESG